MNAQQVVIVCGVMTVASNPSSFNSFPLSIHQAKVSCCFFFCIPPHVELVDVWLTSFSLISHCSFGSFCFCLPLLHC